MANGQYILKEDGFLNIGTESSTITYHSSLNVILAFNRENEVKVLDVHSSVILKSCQLSEAKHRVRGRYLPLQEKILFWDDRNIGLRGDYNGVLLLDTILQAPVPQNDDIVRLEMLLSEAILFQQSLQSLEDHGIECPSDVSNELLEKIKEAQCNVKKSIKAQRWNTVCIELPYSSLKLVANNVVFNLKQLERHIPALAIASAINERLTDLLVGPRVLDTVNSGTFERCLMYSEATRRQTFEKWPHMDYKWALPDQMAQAGFYHQPSSTGEDRAMCFTCNVCLVCWEKTDEPWSEHERHSPNCPFVKGEYTQNVPLSVTYATSPAVPTDGFNVISNTDHSHIMCTSNASGDITIWSMERQLKKMHTFQIQSFLQFLNYGDQISSVEVTAIGVLPIYNNSESPHNGFANKGPVISPKVTILGSKFVVATTVKRSSGESQLYLSTFVVEDEECCKEKITISDEPLKPDLISKSDFVKESSLSKIVSEDNYDCTFYLDFDDSTPQTGLSQIIEDSEKGFTAQELAKLENMDVSKVQTIISTPKTDEIACRLLCSVEVYSSLPFDYAITKILSINEGKHLLVQLQRADAIIGDIEDETLKMEVDEDATTIPGSFNEQSQLQIFGINEFGVINEQCLFLRRFDYDKTARELCLIPKLDNTPSASDSDLAGSVCCSVCMDGTLELIQLNSLETIASVFMKNEKIVSATYCKSLERLCGCTENGSLIFYALRDNEPDSTDEMMDDENGLLITSDTSLTGCEQDVSEIDGGASGSPKNAKKQSEQLQGNFPSSNLVGPAGDSAHSSPTPSLLAYKSELSTSDLQQLYSLTLFDEMLTSYVAEVPGCWNELVQAQKQRRQPQNLRPGDDTHLTKTWRLHNDATTWDEHVIELSLVKPSSLGHIDLKFSLYQQCPNPPAIQVTLLKQNTSGFGYRMKPHHLINLKNDSAVDDNIEFNLADNENSNENPVLTEEYLQAQNAEILAGPIELSSCMDLCDQGGLVTLTSPKLFKTRARNFLLHIKTMVDPSKDGQGKTRVPVRKKGVMRFLFSSFANNSSQNSTNATYSQNSSNKQSRNDYYIGCDWLHEISITVRSTKPDNKILNDRMQRIAMLESNGFIDNLLKLSCGPSRLQQNIALDILIWVCTIRLTRFRSPKMTDRGGGGGGSGSSKLKSNETPQKTTTLAGGLIDSCNMDMSVQQKECVALVEQQLKKLILSCIIHGDRTLAHKAVKLILIVSEGVRNLPNDIHQKYSFDASLRIAIVSCLPFIMTSKYSSAVRWFTFLISATSSAESHVPISECCVKLLMNLTGEINKRLNTFDSLLGSRYGLYGFPFEPDIFDLGLPALSRSNATPNTLANIIKSNAGLAQPGGLDIKKLSSIDCVELRSFPHLIKRKGISNQVRGLLEVEPLHFTCLAASEATRIENMDSLTSSTVSNINMEEIVTSTPLYNNADGFFDMQKKDGDKDNMNDDIMNNVKNILVDKFVNSALKKYKIKDTLVTIKSNGVADPATEIFAPHDKKVQKITPKTSAQYHEPDEYNPSDEPNSEAKFASKIKKYMSEGGNSEDYNSIFSWHKLLSVPPKQMVVIDRIHSGARRYVVLDFGSPVLLTDLVIPACVELASLYIDIWCLDEDTDNSRIVATQDIGTKTLVLSNLQPPPICRYMKITIIGRYGMSATRCKIPIGYFYGHVIILENDAYADPLLNYVKANPTNVAGQIKALKSLYEDVHCRYSLSSSKLIELLTPILNSELCNIAHMHAYINKLKDDDNQIDNAKIVSIYDECISLQHQINIIRNVIDRLEYSLDPNKKANHSQTLASASRDKLRTLSESLIEILLHFTIEYGANNILSMNSFFNIDVANTLFNTLVVSGDAHIQLATCSLLVRMCCFQSWWGDFLANIFCTLYSSQNTRIFPQDRVFFLLSYLGRKSITMGACRSIVIDAILKTLARLLAPISPRYSRTGNLGSGEANQPASSSLWSKSDLQLITWLLLFLSVCLDGSVEKKDKSANRWEFMSCETDLSKSRPQSSSNSGKSLPRCFKKRIIQQNKYNGIQAYTDWSKKMYMLQSELPEIFMELTGKSKPKITKLNVAPKPPKEPPAEPENSFDQGLKSTKIANLLIVIRGLIGLILEMDFTCNMDLFLLTCKVIARLVSACKPAIQLSKVITSSQLEQLIRLAVWNDQQQPWAVHTITCLLQDLLDADKNYKESFGEESENNDGNIMEGVLEVDDTGIDISEPSQGMMQNSQVVKDVSYADTVKYGQLPSLIECEDAELDEFLHDFDIVDRGRNLIKRDNFAQNKNSLNFFCQSVSSALDARLDYGLHTNVEILIRRLTMTPSLDLYDSLPQISTNEMDCSSSELLAWPESITLAWSGPEYNSGQQACDVFKNVFDNIFADLHLQDTWVHLEQLLQMWLTLNSELSEKPRVRRIAFGTNAVQGLLSALAWHSDIKLRTWGLGFHCLTLACHLKPECDGDTNNYNSRKIDTAIIQDENFEKMLLRFFSGYGMNSSTSTNRCVGPTVCKYLHELISILSINATFADPTSNVKRKLKETLLNIILQLVQPGGAISNQQGPLDAQSQLVRDLMSIHYDKADLNVAMSIIESVSFLIYNNISNSDKILCQRASDSNNSNNSFGSLFASVLGSDNPKHNITYSDTSLVVCLVKLSSSLVTTEIESRGEDASRSGAEMCTESQTDEIKAEQQNSIESKTKVPCVADTVLRHFPTMKRLLASLSHCHSGSFSLFLSSSLYQINITEICNALNEPQTPADAVFHILMQLSTKASQTSLVIAPIYQYLESNSSPRNILPRLQLSEPFLWYALKVLETPAAVAVFCEMGGMKILCQNLIKCNKVLMNMQPGLISLIMQHLTKSSKIKAVASSAGTASSSKKPNSNAKGSEGAINFAAFCTISSENSTAQPADVLIQTPIASHRRARTPAWSYMFYPNESYVDLTLTLPTAIMLIEIQIQPHLSSLASCPSAVAVEISRDCGLGPIPFGQAHTTVGRTFIRLKLAKPEIASSIVLRFYRPKDSGSIGLTQISVLGTTIFNSGKCIGSSGNELPAADDDSLAKTGVGWIRILARCFSVAMLVPDSPLANSVITATAEYPGFLEACCTLLNIMPLCSNVALQNLETILLKLGTSSRSLSLSLVNNLLTGTMPQVYRLCNEAVCDLLYDLCTRNDSFICDRVYVLLEWILKMHEHFDARSIQYINPQSGLLKVVASILWTIHTDRSIPNLTDMITDNLFEVCFQMVENPETNPALKTAFDSFLCSLCYIRPELFSKLLVSCGFMEHMQMEGMTDDTKEATSTSRHISGPTNDENLSKLFENLSLLSTLSIACQSRQAVQLLIESKLPKRLAQCVHEFCCSISPEVRKISSKNRKLSNCSLTDSDKAESVKIEEMSENCVLKVHQLPEVLDFFSECCAEGQMRDWLGSYQGSIFWKPLLELLCNHRPNDSNIEPLQQHFIRIERSTINFFSRVTACHPKNQDNLTFILISVIKKPQKISQISSSTIISGFTRRLVLQLLLESEKIFVSVRSQITLQKRNNSTYLVNNHPSKRTNAHHLLFYLSSHTKCQDLLQNCISLYSNILPPQGPELKTNDAACSNSAGKNQNDNHKELLDMGLKIGAQGMELLSVVAGVTAKDKRLKDVKNQAAALKEKESYPKPAKQPSDDNFSANPKSQVPKSTGNCLQFQQNSCPEVLLTSDTTISQILALLHSRGDPLSSPCLELELVSAPNQSDEYIDESLLKASDFEPLVTPLQRFSSRGGLSLLAHYLPTVFPENSKANALQQDKEKTPPSNEWVKVEPNDEVYEDLEDSATETAPKLPTITSVPQHSLAAFGLFLRLPAYSDVLLRDKLRAQCLLRLVLGVTGDGEGNDIYSLSLAPSLPTLPFEVFRQLLDSSPLTTDDGVLLRRMVIEVGAMHLVLNCLGIFTHQSQNYQITGPQADVSNGVKNATDQDQVISDDKSHVYWAKGTGFGTGSTQQSWDVEQALLRQKSEEEHVTVLLQVLSSYINPGDKVPKFLSCDDEMDYDDITEVVGELPTIFLDLLQQSCLVPALSSYLRNDSVLDITRHIPLYRSILQLLRALALSNQLMGLLQPNDSSEDLNSIVSLLTNMKTCVDTYAKRLKVNKKSNIKGQTQKVTVNLDDGDDEGLALLIPDIQETTLLVQRASNVDSQSNCSQDMDKSFVDRPISNSVEQRYLEVMKKLQFDTYEMIVECENGYRFVVSHHFENNVRTAGDRGHPSRVKRLAQETVTLSTSLPLSYSSSVFVRCDNDRLDIMKVLITGPADTPYANGCFEFDVYFPPDYPNSPMLINLETTGRHTVRFNPNLYNDGKVCLSVLNTWHGRPEEKWNAQTSSFLQVLVSIQSLILVPEPYFNEPGFERSRGTPSGTHCSREYNSNIYQACVRWAMLEQIRNPSPCFKEVIHTHFWLKRNEICSQIENWINELNKPQYTERSGRAISFNSMVLRRQYKQLREELAKLPVPEGLEDLDSPFNPTATSLLAMPEIVSQQSPTQSSAQPPSNSSANIDVDPETPTTSISDAGSTSATAQDENAANPNPIQEDLNDQLSSVSSSSTTHWGLHPS